ncbi:MAG: hypothetical protein ACRDJI_11270 [Actinomycetota bacterium]
MNRGVLSAAALAMAVAVVATPFPASAGPSQVVIEDPMGDSNFINDQGTGDGSFGDFNQAGVGNVSDLLKVTLSNDKKTLYILFEAQGVPPATQGLGYRFRVNPDGPGGSHCLLFEAFWPGATNNMTEATAHFRDACEGGDPVPIEILGAQLTVPRSVSKGLGKGAILKAPQAQSFVYSGTYPTGVIGPYMDTTKVGKDYKLVK